MKAYSIEGIYDNALLTLEFDEQERGGTVRVILKVGRKSSTVLVATFGLEQFKDFLREL